MLKRSDTIRHVAYMADAKGNNRYCEAYNPGVVYRFGRDLELERLGYIPKKAVCTESCYQQQRLLSKKLKKLMKPLAF